MEMACIGQAKVALFLLFSLHTGRGWKIHLGSLDPFFLTHTPLPALGLRLSSLFCAPLQPVHWWWRRLCFPTERLWLSSGPADGGHHAGCLLHHGPALVCGSNCPVHHTREQPQTRIWVLCSWRTTQVLGHPRTKSDRPYDLCVDGLLSLHDNHIKGNYLFTHYVNIEYLIRVRNSVIRYWKYSDKPNRYTYRYLSWESFTLAE